MNTDTLKALLNTGANKLEQLSGAVLEAADTASEILDKLSEVLDNYAQDMEPGGTEDTEPKPTVWNKEALNTLREALREEREKMQQKGREEFNKGSRRSAHWTNPNED